MESRYYFDSGITLRELCAGDTVRALKNLERQFEVKLVARENWVQIEGGDEAVARMNAFFGELVNFYKLRRRELDVRDMDFLCRSFEERREGQLQKLWQEKIAVSPKKCEVFPRSINQLDYIRKMRSRELVFGVGPAGTGKTYLAMALAVAEFLHGGVSRIILTRPARESGENLGYLPGSLEEKIMPYLRPLYDALYDMLGADEVANLIERGVIEVAPLAFMRGRTLNNAFIILDEAQNTTTDQMLMFLTRMGFNSRCVVTGDPSQSDLGRNESSGLLHAIRKLQQVPEIGFVFFDTGDVVRHRLLEKIILAYNSEEEPCSKN